MLCLPTAPGCQLVELAISVYRRFSGSSQASSALDRAATLRFVGVTVIRMFDTGRNRRSAQIITTPTAAMHTRCLLWVNNCPATSPEACQLYP
jgi:hypothetical protein